MSINRTEALEYNQKLWDKIAPQFIAGTSLPKYGIFIPTEEDLKLIEDLSGKNALELGCGSGHSLLYLKRKRNAEEIWGIDISHKQIQLAAELFNREEITANLITGSMDEDVGLPKLHFDLVLSIYGMGWTPDLLRALSLVYEYLKPGGIFLFSWEHPVYKCLSYNKEIDGFVFSHTYLENDPQLSHSMKGIAGLKHIRYPRPLSEYVNFIIQSGLVVEKLIEPKIDISTVRDIDWNPEKYFSVPRATLIPATFIMKAQKPLHENI